jgi:hypothetical protein
LSLNADDIAIVLKAARLYWAEVDPSILGTLFERGLDPDKRSQLGAHYTDREKIMMIVDPVIVSPWLAQWEKAKTGIEATLDKSLAAKSASARTKTREEAVATYRSTSSVSGSGPGVWLGQLPLPRSLSFERHRTSRQHRS